MIYELYLTPCLSVEADSEDEAKQYLVDALAGWDVNKSDIWVEEVEDE